MLPSFGANFPILPRSQWKETSLKSWNVPVEDQHQFGQCTGESAEAVMQYAWLISGQKRQSWAAGSVYARINGGRDQGAQVHDALMALQTSGICLEADAPDGQIFMSQIKPQAWVNAKRFRVKDAFKISSFDELGTALSRGFPCASGLAVGNNFDHLDSDGVVPLPDAIRGGHALCHCGLKVTKRGLWVAETKNSWGTSWGLGGYCFIQEGAFNARYGFGFDAYAVVSVYDDSGVTEDDTPTVS